MTGTVDLPEKHSPRTIFASPGIHRFPPSPRMGIRGLAGAKRKPTGARWGFLGAFLLLAGYLLFCHGCHGEEDNDLFSGRRIIDDFPPKYLCFSQDPSLTLRVLQK